MSRIPAEMPDAFDERKIIPQLVAVNLRHQSSY
jgi:hypothetical protein